MRLVELVGPDDISMTDVEAKRGPQHPQTKELGKGREAKAFEHPTHPGSVLKYVTIKREPNESAQVVFTQMAIEHKDNPFFPKIYKAKVIPMEDPEHGRYQMIVEMEKLQPLTGNKIRHMIPHILKQVGLEEKDVKKLIKSGVTNPNADMSNWLEDPKGQKAAIAFADIVNDWETLERMAQYSKNPQFAEAIQAIQDWNMDFNLDLHHDNLMFRLTSVGPQLVILDPLYKIPPRKF